MRQSADNPGADAERAARDDSNLLLSHALISF
jgi:hypothetical protein